MPRRSWKNPLQIEFVRYRKYICEFGKVNILVDSASAIIEKIRSIHGPDAAIIAVGSKMDEIENKRVSDGTN